MIPSEPVHTRNAAQDQMLTLDAWLLSPMGQYIVTSEQAWINSIVPDLFGFRAVQLGTRTLDGLIESRIPHRAYVAQAWPELPSPGQLVLRPDCVAHFEELPFEAQSLDMVVMPHVLEFAQNPHQLLREVERVLMPEGRVVITGFNPMSLWGLKHALFKRWRGVWPEGCEPLHLGRLKDWLKLLSIEPEFGRFGCYRFAATSRRGLSRMGFMELAGNRWWPVCGAAYFLCAVKRVRGMRLVGPAFKQKTVAGQQLKPVAQRYSHKTSKTQDF